MDRIEGDHELVCAIGDIVVSFLSGFCIGELSASGLGESGERSSKTLGCKKYFFLTPLN